MSGWSWLLWVGINGDPALDAPSADQRRAALVQLADQWEPAAFERLDQLLDEVHPREAAFLAQLCAERGRLRQRLVERVLAGPQTIGYAAYAALLERYGRALAELADGAATLEQRAVLIRGIRASDARVRAASERALGELFQRLLVLGERQRIEDLALAFAQDGLRSSALIGLRFEAALLLTADLAPLQTALDAWQQALAPSGAAQADQHLATALMECVAGDLAAAKRALDAAQAHDAERGAELLLARLCCALIAEERDGSELEWARRYHAALLQDSHERSPQHFDAALERPTSFFERLYRAYPRPTWTREQQLRLAERLGAALASVAPREMPGFAPLERVPMDRERALAMQARLQREARELARASESLQQAVFERLGSDPLGPSPREEWEWIELENARENLERALADGADAAFERRLPSALALRVAQDLYEEGQGERAEALLNRLEQDLRADPAAQRWLWGVEFLAELEVLRGTGRADAGEAQLGERELLVARERLELLERELVERGLSPRVLESVRIRRASVCVSLAVNANVRLRQPERALQYFEQAWQLRQDDFMRALRACYLARAGQFDQARAMLSACALSPSTLYNLACTYALLGDKQRALDLLEREFEQNLPTAGTRARQQKWAIHDPDLATLRGEQRFEKLVRTHH